MTTLDAGQQPMEQVDDAPVRLVIIPCLYQESVRTRKENQSQEHNSSQLWTGSGGRKSGRKGSMDVKETKSTLTRPIGADLRTGIR